MNEINHGWALMDTDTDEPMYKREPQQVADATMEVLNEIEQMMHRRSQRTLRLRCLLNYEFPKL
ncbi:hypothetical protein BH23VER1_BH23VER1_10380 [soil metagenome]